MPSAWQTGDLISEYKVAQKHPPRVGWGEQNSELNREEFSKNPLHKLGLPASFPAGKADLLVIALPPPGGRPGIRSISGMTLWPLGPAEWPVCLQPTCCQSLLRKPAGPGHPACVPHPQASRDKPSPPKKRVKQKVEDVIANVSAAALDAEDGSRI